MLLFKIALAPLLIAAVTLAGRKWGPSVAGWLLGLPLTSGPVLLFLALEQGPPFAAHAARGCLLGAIAWTAFNISYAYACLKLNWLLSTLLSWTVYFIVAAAMLPVTVNAVWAFVIVMVVLTGVLLVFPEARRSAAAASLGKYDLWVRMISASAMVFLITSIAERLGPTGSGLLTTFPTYSTILAVFSHRHEAAAAVHVLKGVTAGLYTAAVFFIVLCVALPHLHVAVTFLLAMAAALPAQLGSLFYLRRLKPAANERE